MWSIVNGKETSPLAPIVAHVNVRTQVSFDKRI